VGGGVQAHDDAAKGVANQHIRPWNAGGVQESVKVGDEVSHGARLRNRVATAAAVRGEQRAGSIVGTDASERRDTGKYCRLVGVGVEGDSVPYIGCVGIAGL
jgi:hypothetical protein